MSVGVSLFVPSDLCRLVTSGIPKGHFTHIFVDEAGNALETECLIPLAGKENKQRCVSCDCFVLALFVG